MNSFSKADLPCVLGKSSCMRVFSCFEPGLVTCCSWNALHTAMSNILVLRAALALFMEFSSFVEHTAQDAVIYLLFRLSSEKQKVNPENFNLIIVASLIKSLQVVLTH